MAASIWRRGCSQLARNLRLNRGDRVLLALVVGSMEWSHAGGWWYTES